MDTRFLESLTTVVDEGSIAAAARKLGVTASALSQRINVLEDEIGAQLLVRSGRFSTPTAACIALLPRARQIVQSVRALRADAMGPEPAGPFRLGAISTVLTDWMPDVVRHLAQVAPGVQLTVQPGTSQELYDQLESATLDAALLVAPPFDPPKYLRLTLMDAQPIGLLAPKGTPGSIATQLRTIPVIAYDRRAWGGRLCWEALRLYGVDPLIVCELDALETIAGMVGGGMGVAVVPRWPGLGAHHADLLFQPIPAAPARKLYLISRTNGPVSEHICQAVQAHS